MMPAMYAMICIDCIEYWSSIRICSSHGSLFHEALHSPRRMEHQAIVEA
jgi:hypothetical protein